MFYKPQAYINPMYPYYQWQPAQPYRMQNQSSPYYVNSYPAVYPSYYNHEWFSPRNEDGLKDHGREPFVVNINQVTKQNNTFRTALWTGEHFQVTVMSIPVGEDIGLEVHPATDQFIRIEEGQGRVQMGDTKERMDFQADVFDDYAIMIPAGKWHNVTNTGHVPLKVYVIYAPPQHPYGTVHVTKADAMAAHG